MARDMMLARSVGNCIKSVRRDGLVRTITRIGAVCVSGWHERFLGIRSGEIISVKGVRS
jgi:hypothetical protein